MAKIIKGVSPDRIIRYIKNKSSDYWTAEQKKLELRLFRDMSSNVPAYKNLLVSKKISPKKVRTFHDIADLPHLTKKDYLRAYSLSDMSWNGHLKQPRIYTATSGSTGTPVYFSRNQNIDIQSSVIHELFLKNPGFDAKKPTLIIVAFGMGVWIGGLITYQAFKHLAERGHPLSIITPGINKEEILKILKDLAPSYEQVIITGYPPFLKDIIDLAKARSIPFRFKTRLLFAAEPFTDNFRNHLSRKAKIENLLFDTMNIYGSADMGTMAFETPLSIFVRTFASRKPRVFQDIFGFITKTPTLAQYIPNFTSFTEDNGRILVSGDGSMPLLRYAIGDHGGTFTYKELDALFQKHNIDLQAETKKAGIQNHVYELPFVYVYERSDFSTTLYGLQIYPEYIREILLQKPYDSIVTGKFTMLTKYDTKQNQYLEINLETQREKKVSADIKDRLSKDIVAGLRKKSSEFRELSDHLKSRTQPQLLFWTCEDPLYFKPGIKQKWVK